MKKRVLIPVLILLLLAVGAALFFLHPRQPEPVVDPEDAVREQFQSVSTPPSPTAAPTGAPDAPEEPAAYVSPVDFESLWEKNPEIVAWLDIPGTVISYPILFHEQDNSYYLNHNTSNDMSAAGALFIEDYNSPDFSDPVTLIYGHQMRGGTAFFGTLQPTYEVRERFDAHRTVMLYLPDRQVEFRVFAAAPYNNNHILYNYDFTSSLAHYTFFDRFYAVRSLSANFDEEEYPDFGEQIIILSTCLRGEDDQRYLVCAKEVTAP